VPTAIAQSQQPKAGSGAPKAVTGTTSAWRGGGPRRIMITGVILLVVTIVSATIAAIAFARRASDIDEMLSRTEPMATAAENLYAALSQADASAASAFLSGGLDPGTERQVYDGAVAAAAGALVTAASGVESDAAQGALAQLSSQLPVYTGLVETARADNRLGLPVGGGYLREASGLMRTSLLPAAQTLYDLQVSALADTGRTAGSFPLRELCLAAFVLLALLIGQWLMSRFTRRRLNLGLVVATAATLGWLIWTVIAGAMASASLADSGVNGSEPLNDLVRARISAQQARTDEMLYLIARGTGNADEESFADHTGQLQQLLSAANGSGDATTSIDAALEHTTNQWIAINAAMITATESGDYTTAVATGTGDAGATFGALDASLQQAISDVRQTLRTDTARADSSMSGLQIGIAVLAGSIVVGIATGLWPRVREYQ